MILRVAIALPRRGLFDYLPPIDCAPETLQVGQRLWVPFGHGKRCGLLVELVRESRWAQNKLKPALGIVDSRPLLSTEHLAFLRWVADYYQAPEGEVLFAALPRRLRKCLPEARLPARYIWLSALGRDPEKIQACLARAAKQRQIFRWLQRQGGRALLEQLYAEYPHAHASVRALRQKAVVETGFVLPASEEQLQRVALALSEEQKHAIEQITERLGRFQCFLLDGVTGSGKTEVYLRVAEQVLSRDQQVLLLVPEIALTPQLSRYLSQRLAAPLVLLHSNLSEGEREAAWRAAASARAAVVVGTRSAVLVPLPKLGLVIVDEEQDASYKQQEGVRYSARDLAVVRAQRAACPVVLGTATPALESLKSALEGRYSHLLLRQRVGNARMPEMAVVDIRDQRLQGGLALTTLAAIEGALQQGQQVMVFLNRRGYAPVLCCYQCGWLSDCPHCDARQTVHQGMHKLICHHCGHERQLPTRCPACQASDLHPLGQGTERLESVLRQRFSEYPLVRIDRDTVAGKGRLQALLNSVQDAQASILVGTQMLAKGHHFPRLALVVLVDVDSGLFSVDFRAAERMAQLIVQVAGRAGREHVQGRVLLQSRFPRHVIFQTLLNQGYEAFARQELAMRRQANWPPFSYQALLRGSGVNLERVEAFLQNAAQYLRQLDLPLQIWGPVPAPMLKRAGRYRQQLLLQADKRSELHIALRRLLPWLEGLPGASGVRWSVDVDPIDLY